jgi:hypothetical protein
MLGKLAGLLQDGHLAKFITLLYELGWAVNATSLQTFYQAHQVDEMLVTHQVVHAKGFQEWLPAVLLRS